MLASLLELGLGTKGFQIFKTKVTQFMKLVCHQDFAIIKYMYMYVLVLSETILNDTCPDSAFAINGYQKPIRGAREINSRGGQIVY